MLDNKEHIITVILVYIDRKIDLFLQLKQYEGHHQNNSGHNG